MAYKGLADFIDQLRKKDRIRIIETFADPELEITEITDRITKSGGDALLFTNNGTDFPVLINAFGSDDRLAMALSRPDIEEPAAEIGKLFETFTGTRGSLLQKLASFPSLIRMAAFLPAKSRKRGLCQQIIHTDPDLSLLPVLKCWPHDAGRFITLPIVHTRHPDTGQTNAGMYRMQIIDKKTTAMHWQMHKTGAAHFNAWKKAGGRMPVSVALGGDPVYAYSATAPLPEGADEYILAGFLRKKKVRLVKCITNDLFVPSDADFIIEGYVDPMENLFLEGPFGDHTGFYSLADWYPRFHVTCITHSSKAVYPATIVGIPPHEDAWLARATERIFLAPVRMALQPEILDFHMPSAGVAHNLVIVKIRKSYPGQGMKVINSLFGAGQMMFSKYIVVVSSDIDIRNYEELARHIFRYTDMKRDLLFMTGPLDVLDHSSDNFSFGGKLGIDSTIKFPEETGGVEFIENEYHNSSEDFEKNILQNGLIHNYNKDLPGKGIPVLIVSADRFSNPDVIGDIAVLFGKSKMRSLFRLVIAVDRTVDPFNTGMVLWQLLGNSDPKRDHRYLSSECILLDGTIKSFRPGGFPRKWPNIVCSDILTVRSVNDKWATLELGDMIPSPSDTYRALELGGKDEISYNNP